VGDMPRHLLSVADCADRFELVIDRAIAMKRAYKAGRRERPLEGRTLGMIFEKPSTRTRLSFEVGIFQLGGQGIFLSPKDMQLGRGETVADTARVLSRYVDAIMYRAFDHRMVAELAAASSVPVINALDDREHPCQIMADLMTVKEHFGALKGRRIAYAGDGNNVANSLALGCALVGAQLRIATPPGFEVDTGIRERAVALAKGTGAKVETARDPAWAVERADVVYTDVWTSMGQEASWRQRMEAFQGYQVDEALMALAKPDAIFMHDLPAHRGEETVDAVIEGPQSVVFDQAENRLHAQKALLAAIMGEEIGF
jgi:ornithine carbamoyltransferase